MNILFICTGNTCRSPMAEFIFNEKSLEKDLSHKAKSAGIYSGGEYASENSIKVMSEKNIDITNHISRQVSRELIDWADLILVMGNSHLEILFEYFECREKTFLFKNFVSGIKDDIYDPYGGNMDTYRITRDEIEDLVDNLLTKI